MSKSAALPTTTGAKPGSWLSYAIPVLFVIAILARGCYVYRESYAKHAQPEQIWNVLLNRDRQVIFNVIHPVGQAKSVTVHEAREFVANGGGKQFAVRFTLFWEGPVTKDGYTKILMIWDPEVKRPVGSEVLATNGITNQEFQKAMFQLGWELGEAAARQR